MVIIIFITTIAFSLYTLYKDRSLIEKMLFHPYSVYHGNQWYRIITSGFLHGDTTHLLFNMMTYYFFAFSLSDAVGTVNFTIIYFGSMIIADLPTLKKHKDDYKYTALGASGAISGLLFSFVILAPTHSLYMFFIPIPIPAWIFAIFYVVYSWFADKKGQDNIGHSAHLYGALGGMVLTILLIDGSLDNFISKVL